MKSPRFSKEEEESGLVFDIKKFAVHDGPGIRTTVFLKGCPMKCIWCHNPESIIETRELFFYQNRCIGCGRCLEVCPSGAIKLESVSERIDKKKCILCENCVASCPAEALVYVGKRMSVTEVMREILKDKPFYDNSSGGVTLSGGEPVQQAGFSLALLKRCKDHSIHTSLDTCGYVEWEMFSKLLPYVDLVLYDIKCMDTKFHQKLTGVSNELILENAKRIAQSGKPIIIRVPVIPDCTDSEDNIREIASFVHLLGDSVKEIELLPYNKLAEWKHEQYAGEYVLKGTEPPEEEKLSKLNSLIAKRSEAYFD